MRSLYVITAALLLLTMSSCKKCMVCSSKCYYCTTFSDTLCSTDLPTPSILDTFIRDNEAAGYKCVQAHPYHSEELCGANSNQKDIRSILESKGYYCISQ